MIRRRTTCRVPGHGTWCGPAQEKDDGFPRPLEERLALEFENWAMEENPDERCRGART